MKNLKLLLLSTALLSFSLVTAQTTPTSVNRGNASFTQVDQFLNVVQRIGIPYGPVNTLNATGSSAMSIKLFYNTTTNKLMIHDPSTGVWRDAIEADLTNYYTKAEVDALISGIPKPDMTKYMRLDTTNVLPVYQDWRVKIADNDIFLGVAEEGDSGPIGFSVESPNGGKTNINAGGITYQYPSGVSGSVSGGSLYGLSSAGEFVLSPEWLRVGRSRVNQSNAETLLKFPSSGAAERTLVTSVAGNFANEFGAVTLPNPNLQSVTNGSGNNVTSNALFLTGIGNIPPSIPNGLALAAEGASIYRDGGQAVKFVYTQESPSAWRTTIDTRGQSMAFVPQNTTNAGVEFNTRVKGQDAINPSDFVTKSQLDANLPARIYTPTNLEAKMRIDNTTDNYVSSIHETDSVYDLNNITSGLYEVQVVLNNNSDVGSALGKYNQKFEFGFIYTGSVSRNTVWSMSQKADDSKNGTTVSYPALQIVVTLKVRINKPVTTGLTNIVFYGSDDYYSTNNISFLSNITSSDFFVASRPRTQNNSVNAGKVGMFFRLSHTGGTGVTNLYRDIFINKPIFLMRKISD